LENVDKFYVGSSEMQPVGSYEMQLNRDGIK
jgi:hypothetical protein